MAVLSTKRLTLCGLKKDRKQVLETIQRLGVVEVRKAKKDGKIFKRHDVSKQRAVFESSAATIERAVDILDKVSDAKVGMFDKFDGRKPMSASEFKEATQKHAKIYDKADEVTDLHREKVELENEIPKIELQLEMLKPWLNFDLPLNFEGTEYTKVFIGQINAPLDLNTLYDGIHSYSTGLDAVHIDIISSSDELTCISVVCLKEISQKVFEALQKMEFIRAPFTRANPQEEEKKLKTKLEKSYNRISAIEKEIKAYSGMIQEMKLIHDFYSMRASKYDILSNIVQSNHVFVIRGYIAEPYIDRLQNLLSSFDVICEFEDVTEKEDGPVMLKNNAFAAPLESVVESYSLPGKKELDPTFLTALFYYILFGLMYSDAAYGLLLVISTALVLAKCKNLEPGFRKTLKLFQYCGISTAFWGFMFGSFFGDAIDVIAQTFFKSGFKLPALWFVPVSQPMRMLVFAFGLGLAHLFLGLFAQMYTNIKNGRIKDAIYDSVFWMAFVGGCVVLLLSMKMITDMLGLNFTLSKLAQQIGGVAALIGCVGIIFTAGRESKGFGKRFLKGLYGVYGITGYLSDVLSYSRLLALGLATGVIAGVFNKIGSMFGSGVVGILLFIVVFLIGHTLNFLINVLGAYVHANRLQYVEFYSKFYNGGGRGFEPFTENTKYYKVEED